jgi:actin-related protein 6
MGPFALIFTSLMPSIFPHCTAKAKGSQVVSGDQLADAKEISSLALRRPHDRGYLVNNELEREIWGRLFKSCLKINPRESNLLVTEPLFQFPAAQQSMEQIVFEEFGFRAYHSAPAPFFSMRRAPSLFPQVTANQAGCGVVLDAGFSFTHAVPFFDGQILHSSVKRINIGGKALTNYLKELVSFRSLNMMDETFIVESIKDQLCFVSQDVKADLKLSKAGFRSPHFREFVLPDGVSNLKGYVKEPRQPTDAPRQQGVGEGGGKHQDQTLALNNERFMVPEVLFYPSDIGLQQCGVAEAVVQAVEASHPSLAPLLYSNIILTGGAASCPGFASRFLSELRPMVPDDCEVGVYSPPDPALMAWEGMSSFCASGQFGSYAMTKEEYDEQGARRLADKRREMREAEKNE